MAKKLQQFNPELVTPAQAQEGTSKKLQRPPAPPQRPVEERMHMNPELQIPLQKTFPELERAIPVKGANIRPFMNDVQDEEEIPGIPQSTFDRQLKRIIDVMPRRRLENLAVQVFQGARHQRRGGEEVFENINKMSEEGLRNRVYKNMILTAPAQGA